MSNQAPYFHIAKGAPPVEGLKALFIEASRYAIQQGIPNAVLVVPGLTNLDGIVSEALSDPLVKALKLRLYPLQATNPGG